MMDKKTKIVCTIGPASESKEVLTKLVNEGMNIARLNFSHGSYEEHGNRIKLIREVSKETGKPIGILLDTKGPEIRLGDFENGGCEFKEGDIVRIVKEEVLGNHERFTIRCPEVFNDVKAGDYILMDDGKMKVTPRCGVHHSRKIRMVQTPGAGNGFQLLRERTSGPLVVHGRRSPAKRKKFVAMKAYCRDLGRMDYKTCWDLQQELFDAGVARKRTGPIPVPGADGADDAGTVLLVEHPPVYTLGKSGHAENLLVNQEALEAMGAQFFHIVRGGDITFHGPGQLVCYPILDLERIGIGLREYIEALEEAVIRTVAEYGIAAGRIAGASGVWIDPGKARPRKICAIGVRSSRYVTMHGFALNVTTDLEWFSRINPCGFTDRGVTSIAAETGSQPSMQEVKQLVIRELATALQCEITSGS